MLNIEKPTLIINKDIVLSNINTLLQLSKKLSVSFRPHFKTHQSLEVGKWFKKLGINKITVSFANRSFPEIIIFFITSE